MESCIHKVADFCGLAVDPERLPAILEKCSFAFMKQHETKFDQQTQLLRERGVKEWGFIRKGQVGEWKEYLSIEQEVRFERELRKRLGDSSLSVTCDYLT